MREIVKKHIYKYIDMKLQTGGHSVIFKTFIVQTFIVDVIVHNLLHVTQRNTFRLRLFLYAVCELSEILKLLLMSYWLCLSLRIRGRRCVVVLLFVLFFCVGWWWMTKTHNPKEKIPKAKIPKTNLGIDKISRFSDRALDLIAWYTTCASSFWKNLFLLIFNCMLW